MPMPIRARPVSLPARVSPGPAYWSEALGEFLLPYESVRRSATPDAMLLEFLESSYAAAADLGHWDRDALERPKELITK